jgi:ribosomal protein L10
MLRRSHLIGLIDMHGIPANQLQQIRRDLHDAAILKMTRNTLVEHALQEIGGSIPASFLLPRRHKFLSPNALATI